jgi:hypothetical protein
MAVKVQHSLLNTGESLTMFLSTSTGIEAKTPRTISDFRLPFCKLYCAPPAPATGALDFARRLGTVLQTLEDLL